MYETPFHKENISNCSFLVTGGAGFIGSHIVEYLVRHKAGKIRILDNFSTGFKNNIRPFLSAPGVELLEGDICKAGDCNQACKDIDYVSHQAALGSVPRSIKDPLSTHQTNVTGFINMLLASRDAGVKKFVYASSSSVYGDSTTLPKTEDKTGNPLSPYAVSKQADELYARVFALNYGMQISGLRYFNVFGPRQSPEGPYAAAIPLFIRLLLDNKSPVINGDGNQTRDFTFVSNVVQANIKAFFFAAETPGKVFNIAAGEKISINELFSTIQKNTGGSQPPVYRPERPGDIRDSLADISLAEKYLGYGSLVKFREGIQITLDWFLKEGGKH